MHMRTHPCTHARTHINFESTGGVYMCDDSVPASWS